MYKCQNESKAREQITYTKSCFDVLSIIPNVIHKEDWIRVWRPAIEDACNLTENVELKKIGIEVIIGFNRHFNKK